MKDLNARRPQSTLTDVTAFLGIDVTVLNSGESCKGLLRLTENAHLLRYPHPSSLRRTSRYASFLGISEALHLDIFPQPLKIRFFDSSAIPSRGSAS